MAKGYLPSVEVTDAQYEMLNRLLMELCDLLRVLMVTRGSELPTGELRWPCYSCKRCIILSVRDNPKLIVSVKKWIDQLVYILRSIWWRSWPRLWLLIYCCRWSIPDGELAPKCCVMVARRCLSEVRWSICVFRHVMIGGDRKDLLVFLCCFFPCGKIFFYFSGIY